MTAVLLGTHEPNTPAWHALRADGIGASEIAAVVGLSPYESTFSLWHKKKGNLPGATVTNAMDWGNRLEPLVRNWFAEQHPDLYVIPTPGTYAHGERNWQRVNPDGLILDANDTASTGEASALYEGKTSRFGDGFGPSGSDIIPIGYRCQVQHALDVFGLPRAYVAVLIGGNDPREYVIEADPEDQKALRDAGAAFWESLQTGDEPPIDASFETFQAVKDLHPDIDGSDVPISPALYGRYLASKADADSANAAHRQAKSELLTAMGNARRALVNEVPVLRRQPGRGTSVSLYEIKESA